MTGSNRGRHRLLRLRAICQTAGNLNNLVSDRRDPPQSPPQGGSVSRESEAPPIQTQATGWLGVGGDLDLAMKRAFILNASGHDLAQPVIEQSRRVLVDADQFGRGSRWRASDEVFA